MDRTADHVPVLLDQVLSSLDPRPGDVVVDCTAGRGGHAVEFARAVAPPGGPPGGPTGHIVLIDLDEHNLEFAADRVRRASPRAEVTTLHGSFSRLGRWLSERDMAADVVFADLGVSSSQLDDPGRGMSFHGSGPLDMRMDRSSGPTAADLIHTLSERELADLIDRYGEEPLSRRIARNLALRRAERPIRTTADLVEVVLESYGARARRSRMHPATRTFMALRIAVNEELAHLEALLDQISVQVVRTSKATANRSALTEGSRWLKRKARIGIISFHSLEDRLVKQCFADLARRGLVDRRTKKPITADDSEVRMNPRARSAKLRVVVVNDS